MFNSVRYGRPISGSGQTKSLTTAVAASFTKVGSQTYAVAIRLTYAATPFMAYVRISAAGSNAAANTDYPICSNDPPQVLACAPGDIVSVYQASGSTQSVELCELTQ